MSSNVPGFQAQYQQNYINYYPGNGPIETKPDSEDEESELKPQYYPLPASIPFLSVREIDLDDDDLGYDEIQVSLAYSGFPQPPPACDKSVIYHKPNTIQPIVYECPSCIPNRRRPLCKRCARKEFNDESCYHKPTHHVQKWEPFWEFVFREGFRDLPMVSPSMDSLASELQDDVRAATFRSRKYYDDRIIRCFVPAPTGTCRVWITIGVRPLKNIELEQDIVNKVMGKIRRLSVSRDEADIVGTIAASAYPCKLMSSPYDPIHDIASRPPKPRKKAADITSVHAVDITRDTNCREDLTLCVDVTLEDGRDDGIEILLQDIHYKPDDSKYRSESLKWVLKDITVHRCSSLRPLNEFASMDQIARQQGKEAKSREDDRQQRREKREVDRQKMQENIEKYQEQQEKYKEYMEDMQAKQREKLQQQQEVQAAVAKALPVLASAPLHHQSSHDQSHAHPPQFNQNIPIHPAHDPYHTQHPPQSSTAQSKYTPAHYQQPPMQQHETRGRTNSTSQTAANYHYPPPPNRASHSPSPNTRPGMLAPPPMGSTSRTQQGRSRSGSRSSLSSTTSSTGGRHTGNTGFLVPPGRPMGRSGSISSAASSASSGGSSAGGRRVRFDKTAKPPVVTSTAGRKTGSSMSGGSSAMKASKMRLKR